MNENIECIRCKEAKYQEKQKPIFIDKYLVRKATVHTCPKCGHEVLPEKQHTQIAEKIQKLENHPLLRIINKIKSRLILPSRIQIL